MHIASRILAVLGGLICIAAGVYLLVNRSVAALNGDMFDASMMDVAIHGIGAYAVGRGVATIAKALAPGMPRPASPMPAP
jgi:hypothetical protein